MKSLENFTPTQIETEEEKKVIPEQIADAITEQLKTIKENGTMFDEVTLEERKKALIERPIIDSNNFKEVIATPENEPVFSWVETKKIVGRPFSEQNPGGWSFEYEKRKGRIVEVAKELSGADQNKKNIEYVFHPEKPNERIKLSSINGPGGPIYSVEDGTHRVAGAMVAELSEIPCDVAIIKYPLEQITPVENDAEDWQKKIDMDLIQGKIEVLEDKNGKKIYKLIVEKETLPWIRVVLQQKLSKISQIYEKVYPNSLDNLSIPKDALIDPIANNYFMAGRWEEWQEKFSQKPRDKNRVVIYS